MSTASLQQLLENTTHWDKDERYMATNDLCTMLSKDVKIDEHSEQKICAAVLKQLDDSSNDVQSVAVKCLGILFKKVHQNQIVEIAKKLSSLIVDNSKGDLRDIYSIGLKTLIADVPSSMGSAICKNLTPKLVSGISNGTDDIKRECLDNLSDLLKRFGQFNESEHSSIMSVIVSQLKHEKVVIRKRASQCLGSLAVVSSDQLLNELIQVLLTRIQELDKQGSGGNNRSNASSTESRTLIQTIGTISRMVGYRLGKFLPNIIPLFIRFCGNPDDEETHNDASNELREGCFPGLESFVLRCPKEVSPFIAQIVRVAIAFVKYDPNYSYDDDEDAMDVDGDGNGEEDEDYYDEEEYGGGSDDDDSSWKVRKAAIKVLFAVASAHPQLIRDLFTSCGDDLISRFKEREENVRLDIISCFNKFVDVSAGFGNTDAATSSSSSSAVVAAPELKRQHSSLDVLSQRVDQIVNASCVQLNGQSLKTKDVVLGMLKSLVLALHGGLDRHVPRLTSIIEKLLADKNQSLKLNALSLLRVIYQHHSPSILFPTVERLLPAVIKVANEDWYKSIAEALRVLGAIIPVIRPYNAEAHTYSNEFNFAGFVEPIYSIVKRRLEMMELDIEIKDCAITTMSVVVSHVGDHLPAQELSLVLTTLHRRLDNETTRSSALRAISHIASSNASLDLNNLVNASAKDLSQFFKHHSRTLRQLTLQTLNALVTHPSVSVLPDEATLIVKEVSGLIGDDLHLASLSLTLIRSLLVKNASAVIDAIHQFTHQNIIHLARSPTTQGAALNNLIALLQALASTAASAGNQVFSFQSLFEELYGQSAALAAGEISKQTITNLSKCIAGLLSTQSPAIILEGVKKFAKDTQESNEVLVQLALLSMGETGQHADLSSLPDLKDLLLSCFERSSEDVKTASAYALGHIAYGSMTTFLPLILQSLSQSSQARQQYLLLLSLREVLGAFASASASVSSGIDVYISPILDVLLQQQASATEDSVRNMVADCIGVLTTMNAAQLVPVLSKLVTSDAENKAALRTVLHAVRSTLSRPLSNECFDLLSGNLLSQLLPLLNDSDLEVKKAALLMINTAAHHNPILIHQQVSSVIFPVLIETLKLKLERTVDLGPFKHKVDDNLPLRKLSLNIMGTILHNIVDKFDTVGTMQIAATLLADNDDVKVLFLQLLPRISDINSSAVAVKVDELIPCFEAALAKCAKDADKGGKDVLKVIIKAIVHLSKVEDIKQVSRKWQEFVDTVRKSPSSSDVFSQVENEIHDGY